jgi:hypothetical protein
MDGSDEATTDNQLRSVQELLSMSPADMTELDLDQLRLQTGGMTQKDYEAIYSPLTETDEEELEQRDAQMIDFYKPIDVT